MANKNRYSEDKKGQKSSVALVISFFLAALVFLVLVIFSNSITKRGDRVSVVVALCEISQNTVITKDRAEDFFKTVSVDEDLAYDGVYKSISELFSGGDILVTETLGKNQILSDKMVAESNELIKSFTDPVEMGIRVPSFELADGGTLRRGDTVDVCSSDEAGDEVFIRVYILKAFDNSGKIIEASDTTSVAVAFNVLLERSEYKRLSDVLNASGDFDLVKINDVR